MPPSGTTYNPPNVNAFIKTALAFDAKGVKTTITAGTTSNLDYTLTDDCLITGMELITNNGNYGDTVQLQVIDISGIFTGVVGTVLDQVATGWNVVPQSDTQFDIVYPAKILTGMGLRAVYTSTGSTDVFLGVNYKLHKVLL